MSKRVMIFCMLILTGTAVFGQAGVLRNYVGLISIKYHPDFVEYMETARDNFKEHDYDKVAESIDAYLKGLRGTGFVYVAEDGTNYILTNAHVVTQSESAIITFESRDGTKTVYEGLKVFKFDDEADLAILSFPDGVKPFKEGLELDDEEPDDGMDVFAAGFPGLGKTAIWQFSKGTISNANTRIPKNDDDDETIGPFIQHTAQIDPGNSGGPLLVEKEGTSSNYAVIGMNTLSAYRRQAANYAIPARVIKKFVARALSKEPVDEKAELGKRLDDFMDGVDGEDDVYEFIGPFLTTNCTAANAEYAVLELLDSGSKDLVESINETFVEDPVDGINEAVAWLIQKKMLGDQRMIDIKLVSTEAAGDDKFTVTFNVNGSDVKSDWVKEYGVWRLDTYGEEVAGDKSLAASKKNEMEMGYNLRSNFAFLFSAGYEYVMDTGPSSITYSTFNLALRMGYLVHSGLDFYYGQHGYMQIQGIIGFNIPIPVGSVAIVPFAEFGIGIAMSDTIEATLKAEKDWDDTSFDFSLAASLKGGVMFTMAAVPGLYFIANYQHTWMMEETAPNNNMFGIAVGYGF